MQCQSACSGYRKTIPRMRIRGEKLFCSLAFVILFHIFPINRLLKVESPKISKEKVIILKAHFPHLTLDNVFTDYLSFFPITLLFKYIILVDLFFDIF